MSNLPPGVTENMIPGCGRPGLPEVPEDLVEMDPTTDGPVDEWVCEVDGCDSPIGWHLLRHWHNPDVDQEVWLQAWVLPDDRVVCADCAGAMLRIGEEQRDVYEAAMAAIWDR